MSTSIRYRALLAQAASALAVAVDEDPDGPATQQALLLAAYIGMHRSGGSGDADWDFYTVAMCQAVEDIQADLDCPPVLTAGVPGPVPATTELRRAVVDLVGLLADRYATAAAGDSGSPWRRLVWAAVAHRLDDAVAELT